MTDELKPPQTIYLQFYGDEGPEEGGPTSYEHGDITWCWESIFDHDIVYERVIDQNKLSRIRALRDKTLMESPRIGAESAIRNTKIEIYNAVIELWGEE